MANDQNRWFGTGHLGRDPERFSGEGKKTRSTFSIAINRSYVNSEGERKENATWINCIAFDSIAEKCYQYLKKGQFVVIQGEIQVRKYTARDGAEKTVTEILVKELTAPGGARPKEENESKAADEAGGPIGSYGSDGGPKGYEAPKSSYTLRPDTRTQEELYDRQTGKPIISDDDIPF